MSQREPPLTPTSLFPSYSPTAARLRKSAHGETPREVAPAWPATFEQGVDYRLASPTVHQISASYNEKSRLLQLEEVGVGLEGMETHKSSFVASVFNAVNVLLGTGVLSSPFALRSSGFGIGFPLFLFFSFVTNYTAKLLGRCLSYEEGMQTYPDIGEAAFGTRGRVAISIVFFTELFTVSATFCVLIGDTLAALIPSISQSHLMVLAFLVVMPTTWTPKLSILSYFSILGILSSLFCLYTVFYVGFSTSAQDAQQHGGSIMHPHKIELIAESDRIPLAIGLAMVAFGGHSVFPSICSAMEDKKQYPRMLDVTYVIVVGVYGAIAVCGYLMYGSDTKKEVTLNLIESYPGVLTQLVVWSIVLNPMTKIALTLNPVALAIEEVILPPSLDLNGQPVVQDDSARAALMRVIIRSAIGLSSLVVALYVPHFARVTSFLGAFFAMLASVFFPCVCFVKLFAAKISCFEKWLNVVLAVLSLVFAVIGTLASFMSPAE